MKPAMSSITPTAKKPRTRRLPTDARRALDAWAKGLTRLGAPRSDRQARRFDSLHLWADHPVWFSMWWEETSEEQRPLLLALLKERHDLTVEVWSYGEVAESYTHPLAYDPRCSVCWHQRNNVERYPPTLPGWEHTVARVVAERWATKMDARADQAKRVVDDAFKADPTGATTAFLADRDGTITEWMSARRWRVTLSPNWDLPRVELDPFTNDQKRANGEKWKTYQEERFLVHLTEKHLRDPWWKERMESEGIRPAAVAHHLEKLKAQRRARRAEASP